ncbi:MAG: hypothetical protein COV75_06115 [Candidatus Omnitrophica bacterium CG11_big_fil_rev_8_21_14_0_20_63_9]|nr:MAG: hypothetical protein COV75_06115 [Candidatus Omnitrophica bacterium CG11_big_fil_rev_8_21_14_0_20_63_9]
MLKRNCAWDNACRLTIALLTAGCATPQYAVRGTPTPDESVSAVEIERAVSAVQAKEFERQGARLIGRDERVEGFAVQSIIDRLSRVTERPGLGYRAYLYKDKDPNAAALADGRTYLSTGMLDYLRSRGSKPDELAFVLGHELAHTVAQHLVKRYRALQQQQLLMAVLAAGASAATRNASAGAQQAGRLALNAAAMLQDVANSGYSQDQELEADQLGVRYAVRAGFDPKLGLNMLNDFARFDQGGPFLRTHPYTETRRAYIERYLVESGQTDTERDARLRQLRQTQTLYPKGSVSWQNLQRQIDALEKSSP